MRSAPFAVAPFAAALLALMAPLARAQMDPHQHHHPGAPAAGSGGMGLAPATGHSAHDHGVGPAGSTYDLRWIDAMVQHHSGALRMSSFVFGIGEPALGALATGIWGDQADEIRAMQLWRKAWYPEAPVYPVVLKEGGDPSAMADLMPMSPARIEAMQMRTTPTRDNRVTWFLEGMLQHHGGALVMAHDALRQSSNPTIRRLARSIIVAQRREIIQLRRMLQHDGLNKPEYHAFDALFSAD